MPRTLERWTRDDRPIGLRWHITGSGDLRVGWPAPGLEIYTSAMGWLTDDAELGIIESPEGPIDSGVLDILDERFPGRRWFCGTAADAGENTARKAA